MKHLRLLTALGVFALSTTLLHAHTETSFEAQAKAGTMEQPAQTLCDKLLDTCEEMTDLERARILNAVQSRLLITNDLNDTACTRNALLPEALTGAFTGKKNSRSANNNPLAETTAGPNRSSKHATRTLYMVSTGPLRALLPDPTSHRRHGPMFAVISAMIATPLFGVCYMLSQGKMNRETAAITTIILLGAAYSILHYYHALDDKEEVIEFLKHKWPVVSKKISFPDNVCTMMDYLRKELLAGTLDADEMMDCMDAIQNSGQNE